MATYTKTTPGAPTSGLYVVGDTVKDSSGVQWLCVLGGPVSADPMRPSFSAQGPSELCTLNVGTAGTFITATEYGDGYNHATLLTFTGTTSVLPAIAGGAALGVGKLVYTFPAGEQVIMASNINVGITQSQGFINADTPIVGLGSVIASGVVSVLSGTATFQDINVGVAAANCTGTRTVQSKLATSTPFAFITATAGAKTVHFNVANTWAASGDAAAKLSGTIMLIWKTLK